VRPGRYGSVYEIRTYEMVPGGLPAALAGWQAAVPERVKLSPLIIAMYALDGPSRITHIWPYPGLDARMAIRKQAYASDVWPPRGTPENIREGTSTIAFPTDFSPLA
jgi:NIPSNAP